jgi:ribosomal protein S18 acetylase RimI-like enzyme
MISEGTERNHREDADALIREATVADCAAVAEVHVRSWRESFAGVVPQTFLDKMSVERRARAFESRFSDASYRMYVAEVAGRGVVGFADFGEPREAIDGYEGELYAIYLLPEFQRRGIGERLFNRGVRFLNESGKRSLYLLALSVSPYRSFYEKMGGRVVGRKQIDLEGVMFDELVYGWERSGGE